MAHRVSKWIAMSAIAGAVALLGLFWLSMRATTDQPDLSLAAGLLLDDELSQETRALLESVKEIESHRRDCIERFEAHDLADLPVRTGLSADSYAADDIRADADRIHAARIESLTERSAILKCVGAHG